MHKNTIQIHWNIILSNFEYMEGYIHLYLLQNLNYFNFDNLQAFLAVSTDKAVFCAMCTNVDITYFALCVLM